MEFFAKGSLNFNRKNKTKKILIIEMCRLYFGHHFNNQDFFFFNFLIKLLQWKFGHHMNQGGPQGVHKDQD
jgi:hypothetical protein